MPLRRKPVSLKARALQALALRDHSRAELRGKLLRAARAAHAGDASAEGESPEVESPEVEQVEQAVEALLDELEEKGHLSDTRFMESRVQARSSRFGNVRIRQELRQHGVELHPDVQAHLLNSELERARSVWSRKFGTPAQTPAEAARQMRFLAGRGFSADIIHQVVRARGDAD